MVLGTDEAQEQCSESFLASAKVTTQDDHNNGDARKHETSAGVVGLVPSTTQRAPDMSSVITQVTTRDAPAFRPGGAPYRPPSVGQPSPSSWKVKMRSLLCCFVPSNYSPFQQHDGAGGGHGGGGRFGGGLPMPFGSPPRELVMGPKRPEDATKKTLVLDLDETLVHSSFKPIPNPDFIIPVDIDGKLVDVYVLKRPWMDHFMDSVGPRYEVVVFTASLSKYADPLLDLLDKKGHIRWRLFRESCYPYEGNYVKDLTCLGRDLAHTIIVDNSPHSYAFQPANALPVGTFIDNMDDQELLDMLPVLASLEHLADVRPYLGQYVPGGPNADRNSM